MSIFTSRSPGRYVSTSVAIMRSTRLSAADRPHGTVMNSSGGELSCRGELRCEQSAAAHYVERLRSEVA